MDYEQSWNVLKEMFGSRMVLEEQNQNAITSKIPKKQLKCILDMFENGGISEYCAITTGDKKSLFFDDVNDILKGKMFLDLDSAIAYTKKHWNMLYPQLRFMTIENIEIVKKSSVDELEPA